MSKEFKSMIDNGNTVVSLLISNLVNSAGTVLETTMLTGDETKARELVDVSQYFIAKEKLAENLEEARRREGDWLDGFNAGALHGLHSVTTAYLDTRANTINRTDKFADEDRVCKLVGSWLAILQVGSVLRLLATLDNKGKETVEESKGYIAGMDFSFERTVGTFQARLERKVLDIQGLSNPTEEQRRLSTLLFIALTEPSIYRVISSLGNRSTDIIEVLDKEKLIACVDNSNSRPLRITELGSNEAFRLAQILYTAA